MLSFSAFGQMPHQPDGAEILREMQKLQVTGRVLYLAAHPDDENTRFITWSANHMMYTTAYLSLTRGDGGQNLIGPEIREELGIIRTQELLAARRIDGGQQFFSRAVDFGYSKTSKETQEIWDRDAVLYDMVYVIRQFQPDVIVCRFPPTSQGGHGHHTASAELGIEAFNMVNDPNVYPEQLETVDLWQPLRIVVNTGRWWNEDISADDEGVVAHDIGSYDALLGESNNERSMHSRSQHKSQGFGATGYRGEYVEYFEHLDGKMAENSLFDGIDDTWERFEAKGDEKKKRDAASDAIDAMIDDYDVTDPAASIPQLLEVRKAILAYSTEGQLQEKLEIVDQLILDCSGLYMEVKASQTTASPGSRLDLEFEFINRSDFKVEVLPFNFGDQKMLRDAQVLKNNIEYEQVMENFQIPYDASYSQPYWLEKQGTLGLYAVDDMSMIGKAENDPSIVFEVNFKFDEDTIAYQMPLIYKWNDPVKGELYSPFSVSPALSINFDNPIYLFSDKKSQVITAKVKSGKAGAHAHLNIEVPRGWDVHPKFLDLYYNEYGMEETFEFTIFPLENATSGPIKAIINDHSSDESFSISLIDYDHIPNQLWFPPAESKLVYIDLQTAGNKLGYIPGAGDNIPEAMTNVGYQVDVLEEADLTEANLAQYDAIIVGIRAINTNERYPYMRPALMKYVENGGTLINQYNTAHRLKDKDFAPYPITLSRDRVTEEDAEVTFLNPDHPVLNSPNKITQEDFDGWVQERGLYFPGEWSEEYETILSWHDTGEDAKEGSLLVAQYGEGYYVYTGISFFRELPAGVPGAFRLLANLIALGNE